MTSKEAMDFIKNYILKYKGRLNVLVKTAFELVEQDLERLEKLEIKEKPMKPIIYNLNQYKCPKCLNQIKGQKMLYNMKTKRHDIKCKIITEKVYCPYCGQKLNWKE